MRRCKHCGRQIGSRHDGQCSACATRERYRETAEEYMAVRKFTGRERELARSASEAIMERRMASTHQWTALAIVEARVDDCARVCSILAAANLIAGEVVGRAPMGAPKKGTPPPGDRDLGTYGFPGKGARNYPWRQMQAGDYFCVEIPEGRTPRQMRDGLRGNASYISRRWGGQWQVRTVGGILRVVCAQAVR